MSSPLFDAVNAASQKASADVANQISQRLDTALKQVENEVYNKLNQVIKEDMMDYYYGAYRPVRYKRKNILKDNLVDPVIRPFNDGKMKGFQFGIRYSPEKMHHIKIRGPKATKDPIPPDEEEIALNFSRGIHPNGVPRGGIIDQGLIWEMNNSDNVGTAADIVRQWAKENINKTFDEALSSIMSKL